MSTLPLNYRTRIFLAGDWEGDAEVLHQLIQWNKDENWGLSFIHDQDEMYSLSNCLYCTMKRLLEEQMSVSRTFVLVVGSKTKRLREGSCGRCKEHVKAMITSKRTKCRHENNYDTRGYIQFESELARKLYDEGKISIVVLYNSNRIIENDCPESLIGVGRHIPVFINDEYGVVGWNYEAILKIFHY
jgi:DNA-directed RNA polymerase subunit RPC12/RpoP